MSFGPLGFPKNLSEDLQGQNYLHHVLLLACFTVFTFAPMVQRQRRITLVVPQHKLSYAELAY